MIQQRMKNKILSAGILLFVGFNLVACGGDLTSFANDNLYAYKVANKTSVPDQAPEGYQNINFEFNDGEQDLNIHGWYHMKSKSAPTLIYLHGNATNLGSLNEGGFMEAFKTFEANILVIDYPSYGKSTGSTTMLSLTSSAGEAIRWAKENLSSKIVLWGRSLGAGVTSQAIKEYGDSIQGFVLTSPWNNVDELIKHHFSALYSQVPKDWLAANSYESDKALKGLTLPGLILHGDKDTTIPYKLGKKLFDNLDQPNLVNFTTMEGYEHNDIFQNSQMWQDIKAFVSIF